MNLLKPISAKGFFISFSAERSQLRSLFRKAARGNVYAFSQATSHYTNLISEYLYLAGIINTEERLRHLERILVNCWRYLPYTRRVSDFERFLQIQLSKVQPNIFHRFADPHELLTELSHEGRFLLAARVLEGWSMKSVKLAFRWKKADANRALTELKYKLSGFKYNRLEGNELLQVIRVNQLLEGEYSRKKARVVEKELADQFHAHQFKANWLSYRCDLADLRLDMALTNEQLQQLAFRVSDLIKLQPMEQPRLTDSLINHFSFVRIPSN